MPYLVPRVIGVFEFDVLVESDDETSLLVGEPFSFVGVERVITVADFVWVDVALALTIGSSSGPTGMLHVKVGASYT